jgi:ADP-ribosylglycohydrolase
MMRIAAALLMVVSVSGAAQSVISAADPTHDDKAVMNGAPMVVASTHVSEARHGAPGARSYIPCLRSETWGTRCFVGGC